MRKFLLFIPLLSGFLFISSAQIVPVDSADQIHFFSADFGYHIPQYDMAEWFNNSATIGATYSIKTSGNWSFGADFSYLWGESVKNQDSILRNINNADGNIIDGNGQYAVISYSESGWTGMLTVGKVFPVCKRYRNSGIWIKTGIGFLQHKILIENPKNVAPQIKDDYKKGYDQLANGFACTQFAGYLWISKRTTFSAYAGVEFIEGWTKSRRSVDFNTGKFDNTQKFDVLMGLKVGAIIPLFKRRPEASYIN